MDVRVTREQLSGWTDDASPLDEINRVLASAGDAAEAWRKLTALVLRPDRPFALHRGLYALLRDHWPAERGPLPAWTPTPEDVDRAHAAALSRELGLESYEALVRWSASDRLAYWTCAVNRLGVVFQKPCDVLMDLSTGPEHPSWFVGAKMNIVQSCFQADANLPAIVYRPAADEPMSALTYGELGRLVNRVANSLISAGFTPGEAIAVDMPMNPESVYIYLGIVKAGCAVISIADSFSSEEIAARLRIGKAAGVFTMDYVLRAGKRLPLYEKVAAAGAPRAVVLPCHDLVTLDLRHDDMTWDDFLVEADHFEASIRDPHDVMNILFSSGTTGDPKAIPWIHATPIKGAADAMFHHDLHPGEIICWPTNLGWMMGPWLIFAAMMNKATMALYGDAPTSRGFCEFVQDAGVAVLGVVPSLVRAWRDAGAVEGLDWSAIRAFSSTGECSNAEDMLYLMSRANYRPVVEYIGGTEIGGGFLAGSPLRPAAPATFSTPVLGGDVALLDEAGRPADVGELFVVPPSIGLSLTLLNLDHHQVYYEGAPKGPNGELLRRHGDHVERLPNGYWRAHGRADDTMNLGGVKVSSAEIERALKGVAGVGETAAIAAPTRGGGPSQLVIFAVVSDDAPPWEDLLAAMRTEIKRRLNPLFKIADLVIVDRLPRTASGKVMRRVLRNQGASSATRGPSS